MNEAEKKLVELVLADADVCGQQGYDQWETSWSVDRVVSKIGIAADARPAFAARLLASVEAYLAAKRAEYENSPAYRAIIAAAAEEAAAKAKAEAEAAAKAAAHRAAVEAGTRLEANCCTAVYSVNGEVHVPFFRDTTTPWAQVIRSRTSGEVLARQVESTGMTDGKNYAAWGIESDAPEKIWVATPAGEVAISRWIRLKSKLEAANKKISAIRADREKLAEDMARAKQNWRTARIERMIANKRHPAAIEYVRRMQTGQEVAA